jgi:hypothetical protein
MPLREFGTDDPPQIDLETGGGDVRADEAANAKKAGRCRLLLGQDHQGLGDARAVDGTALYNGPPPPPLLS